MKNTSTQNNEWIRKTFFILRRFAAENERAENLPKELKRLIWTSIKLNGQNNMPYVYGILVETIGISSQGAAVFSELWQGSLRNKILKTNASLPITEGSDDTGE